MPTNRQLESQYISLGLFLGTKKNETYEGNLVLQKGQGFLDEHRFGLVLLFPVSETKHMIIIINDVNVYMRNKQK